MVSQDSCSVDLLPMPHPIKHNGLSDDVVPNAEGSDAKAPLTYASAFEFLDVRRWPEWLCLQMFQRSKNPVLFLRRKGFEILLEA